jgi:hypothetical protein
MSRSRLNYDSYDDYLEDLAIDRERELQAEIRDDQQLHADLDEGRITFKKETPIQKTLRELKVLRTDLIEGDYGLYKPTSYRNLDTDLTLIIEDLEKASRKEKP